MRKLRIILAMFSVLIGVGLFVFPADATPGLLQEKTREYCIDRFPFSGDACERTRISVAEDTDSHGWTIYSFNVKAENNCQYFESSPSLETHDVSIRNGAGSYVAEATIPNIGTGNGCEHTWFTNVHMAASYGHVCYYGFARVNNTPDENVYECWTLHTAGGVTYGWDGD